MMMQFDLKMEAIKQLLEAGIPIDDYARAADWIQDFEEYEESGDPVKDFKTMVLMLNDNHTLPRELSSYCERYQVKYNKFDLFQVPVPDDLFEL